MSEDQRRADEEQEPENPVESGRMPVRQGDEDRRPTGPMSPGTDAPDVDDGRPKGPMSPPPEHQR